MKYQPWKRALCCLLTAVLIFGNIPIFSFAEESDGLCPHHSAHTDQCGYAPASPGSPCTHKHTEDCYQTVTKCIHSHDDTCGYVEAVEGHGCDCVPDAEGVLTHAEGCGYVEAVEGAPCSHVCSVESGCVTRELVCPHIHDAACGYIAPTPEQPCTYVCQACADSKAAEGVQALMDALPTLEEVKAMSMEDQAKAYNQVQSAYDAYEALTESQKALISNAESTFAPLFEYFNSLTAPAATHSHAICGESSCSHGHSSQAWTAWDGTSSIGSAYYYLTKDVVRTTYYYINGDVGICLNGHTLSTDGQCPVFVVNKGAHLFICDCMGGGKLISDDGNTGSATSSEVGIENYGGVILWSGTVSGGWTGVACEDGSVSVYGGTVESSKSEGITLSGSSTAKMTGGVVSGLPAIRGIDSTPKITISGGRTDSAGNVSIATGGSIVISGGTVGNGLSGHQVSLSGSPSVPYIESDSAVVLRDDNGNSYTGSGFTLKSGVSSGSIAVAQLPDQKYANQITVTDGTNTGLMAGRLTLSGTDALIIDRPIASGSAGTGSSVQWALYDNGDFYLLGSGAVPDYSSASNAPWYSYRSRITSLVVSDGITGIGSNAFRGSALTSVSFGNASLSLGNYSFAYCESLKTIDFGSGTITPGECVFECCTALTSVSVPANVTMDGSYSGIGSGYRMFGGCTGLQTATVDCAYVGPYLFEGCSAITQATFTNKDVHFYFLGDSTGSGHPFRGSNNSVTVVGPSCSQVSVLVQRTKSSHDCTLTFSRIAGDTTQHTEQVLPGTATCTEAGLSKGKVCSVCGYVIEAQTSVDALGHDLQSHDAQAATCIEKGWEAYDTCSRCDYTTYKEIPATGHSLSYVAGTGATCAKEGVKAHYHCKSCGKSFADDMGTQEMSDITIPTTSHTEETIPGKAATCTEDGLTDGKKCSVCGKILEKQQVISARHQFDASNKCTVCGIICGEWGDQGTWELKDGCLTILGSPKFDQLCPALGEAPWKIYSEDIRQIMVGNNVGISENAFANLANLEAVTIAAIDGIRDSAFANCGKLNTITFTEAVPFAISQTAFTGVTATAHYTVGEYNTQMYNRLQNYGGNLTWVEHGENAKLIAINHHGSSGGIGSFVVQTFPNSTTADCEFTLSKEGVIELTAQFFRGASYKELSPGEVTVTARDKRTGLSASFTILVPDTKPKDIECPYEEDILIDGYIVRREYRFTPQTTGYYVGYNTYLGEAGGITVTQGDSWVERSSTQYVGDGEYSVYYLTAGETYSISIECDSGLYGTSISFRWDEADTQITSIFFEEESLHFDLSPDTDSQSAWARVCVTPGECSDPVAWSIGASNVAEIQGSDGNTCYLTLKNAGTTTLTATCGGKSASISLVVHNPLELKLNQTTEVTAYGNTSNRLVQFTADETAQYVFTVQGAANVFIDGQMQYPNGYGSDSETYFAEVSAGQTVVLRFALHEDTPITLSVSKAASAPQSMELICLSNTQHEVSFGVSFNPATSMEEIVSWEVSDPDLLGESLLAGFSNSKKYYTPYAKGEVTVTATGASGLTASCTLTVGRCFDGHTNVPQVIAPTCTTGGFTINTCSVCGEKAIASRVDALGHDLLHHDAKSAACTEIGWEAYDTCSRCDYTTYKEISATGHSLSHVDGKDATCTEEGVEEHYHCKSCGKNFGEETGMTELPTVVISALTHQWGEWAVTTPATPEADGEETRVCDRCKQEETRPLVYSGNRLVLTSTELENQSTVWIDGAPVSVQTDDAGNPYVDLPEGSSPILVTYSFNTGSGDRHTQYPTGMQVYRISGTDSGLTVEPIPELQNLLQYSGCSIRITGNKGIRMITSINKSTRSALMGEGLAGYTLVEYGTALCRASALAGGAPLVLGTTGVKSNHAYKQGVADPIFKDTGSLIQYTNVLVGFTDEDCKEDIAMRPYIVLADEKGETFTVYGGIVYRSIGYIAWQNRSAFTPGTAAYEYVWKIIHYVYGDQYDADYKG